MYRSDEGGASALLKLGFSAQLGVIILGHLSRDGCQTLGQSLVLI